jgi:zinc protease
MLPNGLRVVAVEHHRRPVVVIRLVLPRGALSDPPGNAGATHLAVSLASDLHETTPWGEKIVGEKPFRWQVLEAGGVASFEVGQDFSAIGISGWAGDARTYLDLIADAVTRPRHGSESFRGRRDALLDDLEDLESSDPEALERVLAEAAFGTGHPYARSVVGTAGSLGALGLEDVVAQQERVLVPRGATLLVVGDVRPEQVLTAARAAFARWTAETLAPVPSAPPGVLAAGREGVGFLRRLPASTLVVCASRPLAGVRESQAVHDVLAALLGEGSGSRLAEALRERNGLTYGASAAIVRRRHARAFLACSPVAADRGELGVRIFRETLEAARRAPPIVEELERAKAVLIAELESAHDDAFGSAHLWLEATTTGAGRPRLEEERAEIERVSAEAVQRLARDVLRPEALRWIVSGDPRAAGRAVEANHLGRLQPLLPQR